jgi:predicted RNA methylase
MPPRLTWRLMLALVLAVDASSSMEDWERKMQREGYASAVTSRAVLKSIADGKHHRYRSDNVRMGIVRQPSRGLSRG